MRPVLLLGAAVFALSLSIGQVLLKIAAEDVRRRLAISWFEAAQSVWLALALLLYAVTTVLWLWLLTQLPLTRAYPFALLGAALVPIISSFVLHESIGWTYTLGMSLVICGVTVIQLWGH